MNDYSLLKETSTAEFIVLNDQKGNVWKSIAIHTKVDDHPIWKGLHYTQYFALLPGVPVVAYFVKVNDSGGKSLIGERWTTEFFIKGESIQDLSFLSLENNPEQQYDVGAEELNLNLKEINLIQSKQRDEKLYLIKGIDSILLEGYMNKEALELINVQKANICMKPSFLLFDQRKLSTAVLRDLRQIEF